MWPRSYSSRLQRLMLRCWGCCIVSTGRPEPRSRLREGRVCVHMSQRHVLSYMILAIKCESQCLTTFGPAYREKRAKDGFRGPDRAANTPYGSSLLVYAIMLQLAKLSDFRRSYRKEKRCNITWAQSNARRK